MALTHTKGSALDYITDLIAWLEDYNYVVDDSAFLKATDDALRSYFNATFDCQVPAALRGQGVLSLEFFYRVDNKHVPTKLLNSTLPGAARLRNVY